LCSSKACALVDVSTYLPINRNDGCGTHGQAVKARVPKFASIGGHHPRYKPSLLVPYSSGTQGIVRRMRRSKSHEWLPFRRLTHPLPHYVTGCFRTVMVSAKVPEYETGASDREPPCAPSCPRRKNMGGNFWHVRNRRGHVVRERGWREEWEKESEMNLNVPPLWRVKRVPRLAFCAILHTVSKPSNVVDWSKGLYANLR